MNHPTAIEIRALGPRLDAATARAMSREVDVALRCGVRAIVVDLAAVESIDATGVAALGALHRRAPAGARIVLAGIRDVLLPLARATHLHDLYEIFGTAGVALRAVKA